MSFASRGIRESDGKSGMPGTPFDAYRNPSVTTLHGLASAPLIRTRSTTIGCPMSFGELACRGLKLNDTRETSRNFVAKELRWASFCNSNDNDRGVSTFGNF